jgi:hypothetical protein
MEAGEKGSAPKDVNLDFLEPFRTVFGILFGTKYRQVRLIGWPWPFSNYNFGVRSA